MLTFHINIVLHDIISLSQILLSIRLSAILERRERFPYQGEPEHVTASTAKLRKEAEGNWI